MSFQPLIVDLSGAYPRLLDLIAGRSGMCLSDWVSAHPAEWRAGVTVAALYPCRTYATALRTHLPRATRVLDAGFLDPLVAARRWRRTCRRYARPSTGRCATGPVPASDTTGCGSRSCATCSSRWTYGWAASAAATPRRSAARRAQAGRLGS